MWSQGHKKLIQNGIFINLKYLATSMTLNVKFCYLMNIRTRRYTDFKVGHHELPVYIAALHF